MNESTQRHRCSGVKTSGYWKGHPCNAVAKYQHGGRWYCKNHLPIEKEPSK